MDGFIGRRRDIARRHRRSQCLFVLHGAGGADGETAAVCHAIRRKIGWPTAGADEEVWPVFGPF